MLQKFGNLFKHRENDPLGEKNHKETQEITALYKNAVDVFFESGQVSASILQRKLCISFNNACDILSFFESEGLISKQEDLEPRKILGRKNQFLAVCYKKDDSTHSSILSSVDAMDGAEFEKWCAKLLSKNGYTNVTVTKASGDQGVDVLAEKDGLKFAIQCKCYASDLGNSPVQEVAAGRQFYGCHVGIVITNRGFTSGAEALAEKTGVLLWGRDKLKELIALGDD